jgi:hypothetical protein
MQKVLGLLVHLARTSGADASIYDKPYMTEFDQNVAGTYPTVNGISASQGAYNILRT